MNKAIPALTLLCGFLLGVIAGPWLWPRGFQQAPVEEPPAPVTVVAAPAPPPPPPLPPPPPEPELVLKGVFVGADASRSRALIASDEASPRLYKPDDKLPDGSVLKAVSGKDVEIEKNGETRTLTLERGKSGTGTGETAGSAAETEGAVEQPSLPATPADAAETPIEHGAAAAPAEAAAP
jgi:type II secretory pathway component PulC